MNTNQRLPLDLAAVQVSGALDQRIRLGLEHLLRDRGRILRGEGHGQGWGLDQAGRWVGAVGPAARYIRGHIPELDETMQLIVDPQEPNGFFGDHLDSWPWAGASRGLVGLVDCWEGTGDSRALDAATRLGDFYLSHEPLGLPYVHVEGLVALYRVTGTGGYLDVAKRLARGLGEWSTSGHTHSYLVGLRGMIGLYFATGKSDYLEFALGFWDMALRESMWVSGGISEQNTFGYEIRDETCSVADWFRLSLALWRATGESKYLDVAEHTLINHLYFDQDHTGGFCTYRSIGDDHRTRDFVAWFCCSMHGLRGLLDAVRYVCTHAGDTVDVNLHVPFIADVSLPRGSLRVRQVGEYPTEPVARIAVDPEKPMRFTLRARVPAWTDSLEVLVNGTPLSVDAGGGQVSVERLWERGDVLEMRFSPRLELVPEGCNGFVDPPSTSIAQPDQDSYHRAALVYGPLVLMVDPVLQPHQMYDWGRVEILVPRGPDGSIHLMPVETPIPGRGELSVPGMCFMTLGRPVKGEAGKVTSIFNPNIGVPSPDTFATAQSSDDWHLVFLVPISEVTDRWTATLTRIVAYEVRNDVQLVDLDLVEGFKRRAGELFETFVSRREANTPGYKLILRNLV